MTTLSLFTQMHLICVCTRWFDPLGVAHSFIPAPVAFDPGHRDYLSSRYEVCSVLHVFKGQWSTPKWKGPADRAREGLGDEVICG